MRNITLTSYIAGDCCSDDFGYCVTFYETYLGKKTFYDLVVNCEKKIISLKKDRFEKIEPCGSISELSEKEQYGLKVIIANTISTLNYL